MVFSIYVSTYNVDTPLSSWAQRDLKIVKNAKHSDPDNDFNYRQETVDLSSKIQCFVLNAYDKKSSFRIYTQHFRMGNKRVTFPIYDYWCQSYKKSFNFTQDLLKGFKIKI
ncbi:MAG: nuclear transport factor 2 (NTF2) superfamily protein [Paraglaciecola sp.]|jgi:nuclear transport factor 2 (NTF2) superfamily protein